jgi:hypothetical protein
LIVASDQRKAPLDAISLSDCPGLSHSFGGLSKMASPISTPKRSQGYIQDAIGEREFLS